MKQVSIQEKVIGGDNPVYVIAEIGYNFNTIEEAKASIDAAAECGVDAVKFQTFRAETVTSRFTDFPAEAGATNQFDEFKQYELSAEAHRELFAYAGTRGLTVFSTPAYYDDVELLEGLDVPVYKIGSDDMTNLPFLRYVAGKGKPIIFSTGMATIAEVAEALETINDAGNDQVIILYCVSNYPIKDLGVLDLNVIPTFVRAFGVPIGFSDHTTSMTAAIAAVALGAKVIERHFTLDKNIEAPDASFSADPQEMKALVRAIRDLEQALGDGIKRPSVTEAAMRSETRKSVIAAKDIAQGTLITDDMLIVKRPGTGIAPKLARLVPGRRARQAIKADEVINWEHLE